MNLKDAIRQIMEGLELTKGIKGKMEDRPDSAIHPFACPVCGGTVFPLPHGFKPDSQPPDQDIEWHAIMCGHCGSFLFFHGTNAKVISDAEMADMSDDVRIILQRTRARWLKIKRDRK